MENTLLPVNTVLYTKNGMKIGNAIVIAHVQLSYGEFHEIKTDYGNVCLLSREEVDTLFNYGAGTSTNHKYSVKL